MKINKKVIKKKKVNKKKTKKIIKQNIAIVSEKISSNLDKADINQIKNITSILTPKVALRICNETLDIESTGGLNDPNLETRKLTKLESLLYLIKHDPKISETKKNAIFQAQDSAVPLVTKINKRQRKKIRNKVKGIQNKLDQLCLNQVKNQTNSKSTNYFAIQSLNKLNQEQKSQNKETEFNKNTIFIKPSTFNLNLNNGDPILTPNYSNQLISKPKLDLNQINFSSLQNLPNSNIFKNSNSLSGIESNALPNNPINIQINHIQNFNININETNVQNNMFQTNTVFQSTSTKLVKDSVASLLSN